MTSIDGERPDFWFNSEDDRERIRGSAATEWGRRIMERMRMDVEERRCRDLVVPTQPAGYGHNYFCPVHNTSLVFDWDRPRDHLQQDQPRVREDRQRRRAPLDQPGLRQRAKALMSYIVSHRASSRTARPR